ncbi:HAD hydrolase-like protein, partial [Pseudomonas aeruginosa]
PWDMLLCADLFGHYKPDPQVYLGACRLLDLPPQEVMLCAAHNYDLKAARALGLKGSRVAEHPRARQEPLEHLAEFGTREQQLYREAGEDQCQQRHHEGLQRPLAWGALLCVGDALLVLVLIGRGQR